MLPIVTIVAPEGSSMVALTAKDSRSILDESSPTSSLNANARTSLVLELSSTFTVELSGFAEEDLIFKLSSSDDNLKSKFATSPLTEETEELALPAGPTELVSAVIIAPVPSTYLIEFNAKFHFASSSSESISSVATTATYK